MAAENWLAKEMVGVLFGQLCRPEQSGDGDLATVQANAAGFERCLNACSHVAKPHAESSLSARDPMERAPRLGFEARLRSCRRRRRYLRRYFGGGVRRCVPAISTPCIRLGCAEALPLRTHSNSRRAQVCVPRRLRD